MCSVIRTSKKQRQLRTLALCSCRAHLRASQALASQERLHLRRQHAALAAALAPLLGRRRLLLGALLGGLRLIAATAALGCLLRKEGLNLQSQVSVVRLSHQQLINKVRWTS